MTNQTKQTHRRRGPSLFGPVLLISVGVYFLLRNLGYDIAPELNLYAALQLWPLLLIFLGINVLVRQAPGTIGSFLSGLVGLMTVLVFGYVLLFADENPLLERFGVRTEQVVVQETVSFAEDGVETADIFIDLGSPGANITPLNNSNNLIEGDLDIVGNLIFQAESRSSGLATVRLDEENNQPFFFFGSGSDLMVNRQPWEIGLSPNVPLDLELDLASGVVEADLTGLQLEKLQIDGASGVSDVRLPEGNYDVLYDVGSGSTTLTLPPTGQFEMEVEGGSGSLTINLPTSLNARIEIEDGSGGLSIDDRFALVDGEAGDDAIYESPNFDADDDNVLFLKVDIGSGRVTITQPQGR